jgi:hypothetical protein
LQINCDCCGHGVLEIKCPYNLSEKSATIDDYLKKNKCLVKEGLTYKMNEKHSYYYQIQLQMTLSNTDYGDFVIWRASVGEESQTNKLGETIFVRVPHDPDFIRSNIRKAELYFDKVIVPELLAGYFSRKGCLTHTEQQALTLEGKIYFFYFLNIFICIFYRKC